MAPKSGIFKPNSADNSPCRALRYSFRPKAAYNAPATNGARNRRSCNSSHRPRNSASRTPGASWPRCLRPGCWISICRSSNSTSAPPPGGSADWQPGAILRLPFSERLCRNGGVVCGQALMAFADTAMVIANVAANRGFRPMTTVDQTTHFMRAATGLRRAGRCARGSPRPHHELWPRHALQRHRQQAGGDGLERVRDAAG